MTVPPRSFPMTRFTHHTVAVYLPFGAGPFFVVFLCGSFIFNIQQLEYHFLFAPAEALNVTTQLVSKAKDPIFYFSLIPIPKQCHINHTLCH